MPDFFTRDVRIHVDNDRNVYPWWGPYIIKTLWRYRLIFFNYIAIAIGFLINYQPDTVSVPLKMVKIRTKIKHLERKALVEDYVKHMAR